MFSSSRLEVGSSARIMSEQFVRALITAFARADGLLHWESLLTGMTGARESYIEILKSSLVGVSIEANSVYFHWNHRRSFYGCGGCIFIHFTECGETTD